MSKRFLDTGFLNQKWIKKLTPERKSFLIYLMLKCDNAGIIELDMDDAEYWIGKKVGEPSEFLPESYLIPISGTEKYFMPKFIEWQYGDLSSNKNIVAQARQILEKHNLINEDFTLKLDNIYIKVTQSLPESQVTSNSKGIGNGNSKGKEAKKKCLMKNSGITIQDIKETFLKTVDIKDADPDYYFNSALDWSDSKGEMRDDWIATVRNFARKDIRDGKLKTIYENNSRSYRNPGKIPAADYDNDRLHPGLDH